MKEKTDRAIGRVKKEIKKISDSIHATPETGFNEKKACAWQIEFLKKQGFSVEYPAGGIKTAYKASFGKDTPVFCFMAEYDALPEKGHACGHNLIAASALAAGIAVKEITDKEKIPGKIIIMGCPAEEAKGGKLKLIEKGCFNGIDAALISHPYTKTLTETTWLSVSRYNVSFKGKSAHASVSPHEGHNALEAVNLLFSGINAWRQHLPESSRVHGIITQGGDAPNIVPDKAECFFYLRAENEDIHSKMKERFKNIVKGAALMTGTTAKCVDTKTSYSSSIYNKIFDDEYLAMAKEEGMNPEKSKMRGRGSSDFANVSQLMPCINLFYGITEKKEAPLHSEEFRKAAGSTHAFEQSMKTASIMARIALKYIKDKKFRKAADADFKERKV